LPLIKQKIDFPYENITQIPMSSPDITDIEREAVAAVLQTPMLSMGPQIQAFEQVICEYIGVKHAIAVNAGTSGLHLCIRAAGIEAGDRVLTTPFSFVASANAILFEKAIPVFVDVDPLSGNIDPSMVETAVHDLTQGGKVALRWLPKKGLMQNDAPLKAILPVDVFGQPADLDPICSIARAHNLRVIEDSCEAIGAEYKGRKSGTLGDYGVFAFYPNKQMTTGEGGIIITNNDEAAAYMRALRNQGRSPSDTWLQHTHLGYNYRLDEISAVLGKVQVTRLDELLSKREQVAGWYNDRLAGLSWLEIPEILPTTTRMSWFVYVVRFSRGTDRDVIAQLLKERGIPARPYFVPIHLQPYMVQKFGYLTGDFPVTEDLGSRGLALPFSGVMTESQVDRVCETIREIVGTL